MADAPVPTGVPFLDAVRGIYALTQILGGERGGARTRAEQRAGPNVPTVTVFTRSGQVTFPNRQYTGPAPAPQPRPPEIITDRPLPGGSSGPAPTTPADRPPAPSDPTAAAQAWRFFGVGFGPPRRGGKRRRKGKRRATRAEELAILNAIRGRVYYNVQGYDDPDYNFAPGGPGLPQTRAPVGPTSILAVLGRWVLGRTILGVLLPSSIDPEIPIPRRSPGPNTRGGRRRPPTQADVLPAIPKRGSRVQVVPAPPVTRPTTRTGQAQTLPGAQPATTPTQSAPLPRPAQPTPSRPGPSTRPPPATSGSVWSSALPYLLPFLLPARPRMARGQPRVQLTNPIDPLTGSNPGLLPWPQPNPAPRPRTDECVEERPPRKKRKRRLECRQGTYTETATGLRKRPKRKIQCQ